MAYNNPTPVAVALIAIGDEFNFKLLTVCRKLSPVGGWALPGGFVDEGETAEIAVNREVEEECGLKLDVTKWQPVTTRITPRNQLLIFMGYGEYLEPEDLEGFVENSEVSALGSWDDLTHDLCFPLHTDVARAALRGQFQ